MAATTRPTRARANGTHDVDPAEEPTGLIIGGPEIAAGIEEPDEPTPAPPDPGQHTTRPPELGELIAYADGTYRVYRTERRHADPAGPAEVAIYARLERRR
jgi:hypothetical protein